MTAQNDGPAPTARPSPAEARAALAEAARARQALSGVTGPRWATAVVVASAGLFPLAQLLPTIGTLAVTAVLSLAIVAAIFAYAAHTGVTYRPQRSWVWAYLPFTVAFMIIFVGGGLLDDLGLWWIWIIAAPLNMASLILLVVTLRRLAARQGP